MNTRLLLLGIALAGSITAAALAASAQPQPAPAAQRPWLSIPQIHDALEAAGYRNIEKIERERGNYEVKATSREGQRVKLYVHPQTGEILDLRRRDAKQGKPAGWGQRGGQPGIECNERRCRDDLPAVPGRRQ